MSACLLYLVCYRNAVTIGMVHSCLLYLVCYRNAVTIGMVHSYLIQSKLAIHCSLIHYWTTPCMNILIWLHLFIAVKAPISVTCTENIDLRINVKDIRHQLLVSLWLPLFLVYFSDSFYNWLMISHVFFYFMVSFVKC